MRWVALLLLLSLGCGAPVQQHPVDSSDLVEPLFTTTLPDPPDEVPEEERFVVGVSHCFTEGEGAETPPGIYMTEAMAQRAGRLRVAYDEIRGLYEVDLRTMGREREVYQRQLDLAEDEVAQWRERAHRGWFERNRGWLGLGIGLVVGAGLAVGMAAALDEALGAVE